MANVFAAATIPIADRRRGLLLAYKGYLFSRKRMCETRMYWRCIDNRCGVFVHVFKVSLDAENIRILRELAGRSHRRATHPLLVGKWYATCWTSCRATHVRRCVLPTITLPQIRHLCMLTQCHRSAHCRIGCDDGAKNVFRQFLDS